MLTDSISDFIIQIKNGYMAHKDEIIAPSSNNKEAISRILSKYGYIGKIDILKESKNMKKIKVELLYKNLIPQLTNIVRISKPGKKVYVKASKIPKVIGGMGDTIITTPMGMLSGKEAKRKGVGGELICKFW